MKPQKSADTTNQGFFVFLESWLLNISSPPLSRLIRTFISEKKFCKSKGRKRELY